MALRLQGVNMWDLHADGAWAVIPICNVRRQDGRLVMGKGLALDAVNRYPGLDRRWGRYARLLKIAYPERLIGFPTKHHWSQLSDLELIRQSAEALAKYLPDDAVVCLVPQVGCGLGGLSWPRQVRPLLEPILQSDCFVFLE